MVLHRTTWYARCSSAVPRQRPRQPGSGGLPGFLYIQLFGTLESDTSPHHFHIWVVLPSKELVAAVSPHDVFIYRELYFTPKILLFVRSHRKPENSAATGVGCQEKIMIATRNRKLYFNFSFQRKTIPVQSCLITWKTDKQLCSEQQIFSPNG